MTRRIVFKAWVPVLGERSMLAEYRLAVLPEEAAESTRRSVADRIRAEMLALPGARGPVYVEWAWRSVEVEVEPDAASWTPPPTENEENP